MDTDMDTSLRDRLVRTRIRNNVERGGGGGGQTASTLSQHSRKQKKC